MRVGHLIKGLGRGGAEALLPLQVRVAPETDFRAGYFLPWKDALVADLEAAGCPVHCFDARSNAAVLMSVGRVREWIRRERLDIVHCHLPLSGIVARVAGAWERVPVVYTEHNLLERYHPATRLLNLATWRLLSHVVTVSSEVAQSIESRAGASVAMTVVRNGIDTGTYRAGRGAATAKRAIGISGDGPVVGTVAVFRVQKRLDRWLAAARRIVRANPSCRFLLVGDGPEKANVEREIARLGLGHAVILPGLQPDVRPYLAAMDVFMISSDFEGLPLALLEAMASGLPVVATPVGGIPEVLRNGGGSMVRGEEELAARVGELLERPEERLAMGSRGRKIVETEFGIERMAADLDTVYRAVLAAAAR